MDITTFHLKAGDFRSDFSALPAERTSARNSLFRSFLAKLPPTLKAERRQFEAKLLESEIIGTPLPWKFEQLVQLVANYNVLAARDAADDPTINMADASQRPKPSKPPAGKTSHSQPCPCCGKTGHYARDCPTACSICKLRSCPGNYGSPCVVAAPSFPAAVLNALGRPLPPAIKRILMKAHTSKAKPAPQTANANHCQAATNSDNFWGDEPPAEAEINMLHAEKPEYTDVGEEEAEAWLNQWRAAEVELTKDRNVTLPLCHGTRELQEHATRGDDTWRLVLRLGSVILGLAGAALHTSRRKKIVRISQVYVVPEYRGQGIARGLVSRLLARAVVHGAQYMGLGLGIREQRSTISFWTTYGFTIADERSRLPTINDDLIPITPSLASYNSFPSTRILQCSHADASPSSCQQPHLVLLDGGSNVNLFSNADVLRHGTPVSSPPLSVTGWHASSAVPVTAFYKIGISPARRVLPVACGFNAPRASHSSSSSFADASAANCRRPSLPRESLARAHAWFASPFLRSAEPAASCQ